MNLAWRWGREMSAARDAENGNRLNNRSGEFEALLKSYSGIVYWLAFYVTGDSKGAEDVLEKTFLAAQSGFPNLKQNESSVMRLARTAVTESLAKLDAAALVRWSQTEAVVAFAPQEIVPWNDDVEKSHGSDELRRIVREGMQSLAPFSRIVLLLRDVAKLRTEEIADLFHVPVPSVKSHSLRSRLQLREHLSKYFKSKVVEKARTA